MMVTVEELFPWLVTLASSLEAYRYPIYVFNLVMGYIMIIPFAMLVLGYEPQLLPRPKIVKFKYKWTSKSVALFGMLTALLVIAYVFGGMLPVIPGIISLFVLAWILEFSLPCIFGWPGIWAAIAGEFLGEIIMGWFYPAFIPPFFAHLGFLGWFAWKTFGRDTSFKTARSWGWWILGYLCVYAPLNMFGWGAQMVFFGIIPLDNMFIFRSTVNFINYYFPNVIIQVPLVIAITALAKKYRLHWQTMEPQPYVRQA